MAKKHKIKTPEGDIQEVELTASLAIKCFCTECMGWEGKPSECTSLYCPLYPFRGKSLAYLGPRQYELTDEQKEKVENRLRLAREARGGKNTKQNEEGDDE